MSFEIAEFDQKIGEFELAISQAFSDRQADAKMLALKDLLLAQLRVCAAHYRLMAMESDGRVLLSEKAFTRLLEEQLQLSKFFRRVPKSSDKSTYEMKSVYPLYTFIENHFEQGR